MRTMKRRGALLFILGLIILLLAGLGFAVLNLLMSWDAITYGWMQPWVVIVQSALIVAVAILMTWVMLTIIVLVIRGLSSTIIRPETVRTLDTLATVSAVSAGLSLLAAFPGIFSHATMLAPLAFLFGVMSLGFGFLSDVVAECVRYKDENDAIV